MSTRYTTEEFISQAKAKHGDKYTYLKTDYKEAKIKVIVTCRLHGDFKITPDSHKRGSGCCKCGDKRAADHKRTSLESFITKAKGVHGELYDYSKVEYVTALLPVEIICRSHGPFFQTPGNHTSGKGCKSCQKNGYRPNLAGTLYVLQADNLFKIGITNRKVKLRIQGINRSSKLSFELANKFSFDDGKIPLNVETALLKELKAVYKQPSTVFDGSTECFYNVDINLLYERIDALIINYT